MSITAISSYTVFGTSKQAAADQGTGGFSAALRQASGGDVGTASFRGLSSSPIAAGQSLLSPELWPARFDVGIKARAEEFGSDVDALKAKFAEIMEKASETGGYSEPKSFLKSLTAEEREVLQVTQGMGAPITEQNVDGLSEEGALNLLLPPGAQRDWNGDALYSVGRANGFRFPTDSTPVEVKAAWAETTAGMSDKELMFAEGHMLANLMSANAKQDAAGNFSGFYEPSAPQFKDPFGEFNFAKHASERLAYNEHIRHQIPEEQYQRDKAFWSKLGSALGSNA